MLAELSLILFRNRSFSQPRSQSAHLIVRRKVLPAHILDFLEYVVNCWLCTSRVSR